MVSRKTTKFTSIICICFIIHAIIPEIILPIGSMYLDNYTLMVILVTEVIFLLEIVDDFSQVH